MTFQANTRTDRSPLRASTRCFVTFLKLAMVAGSMTTLGACSLMMPRNQTISITSDPSGATVTFLMNTGEKKRIGPTPASFSAPRDETCQFLIAKEGYQTEKRMANPKLSATGWLDSVGTPFLILPIMGVISAGARTLEPKEFHVVLEPKDAARGVATEKTDPRGKTE